MPHYANPILDADWPDPDAVAVDGAYYLIASSFNRTPGLPVLRSTDLVDWEIIGHALPQVPPVDHFRLPRHGGGVWAPSIRHHGGRFVIVYPDPDHGLFVLTAENPAGPWSAPRSLIRGRGLIDPCPLWDDDGRAYLVFGWARSRSGIANRLTMVEVDADLTAPIGEPRTVIDGDRLPGFRTLEGPKLYRRDGWYWIFAPAGGVTDGWQSAFRSRSIWGPYQQRRVLEQGSTAINGPHQGAWLTDAGGSDWFLHFQDRGCFGRVVHLQPMGWDEDGWPVIGNQGAPVLEGRTIGPDTGTEIRPSMGEPDRNDDFTGPLNRWWHWPANPDPDWARTGDGTLHLHAAESVVGDLRETPAVLAQQLPGQPTTIVTAIDLDGPDGSRAGVVVLGREYQWLGLVRRAGGLRLQVVRSLRPGQQEALVDEPVAAAGVTPLSVQIGIDADGSVRFCWRATADVPWQQAGPACAATAGRWIGAEIGVFADRPVGTPSAAGIFAGWAVTRRLEVEA